MSVLDKLSVTDAVERVKGYDPIRIRRKKLAAAIQDQMNLLAAEQSGETYRRIRVQRKRDLESDELVDIEQQRRVTQWWWIDDDGSVKLSIRYGSTRLRLKDGKEVIVLTSLKALADLLPPLRQEVLAGGLDEILAAAADDLQARFVSRKKAKAKSADVA